VLIEVSSVFRLEDAQQIAALLASAVPGADVDLDFRDVHECEGPALARLVDVIRSEHARVALHGVSKHFGKLLQYLNPQMDSSPRSGRP